MLAFQRQEKAIPSCGVQILTDKKPKRVREMLFINNVSLISIKRNMVIMTTESQLVLPHRRKLQLACMSKLYSFSPRKYQNFEACVWLCG